MPTTTLDWGNTDSSGTSLFVPFSADDAGDWFNAWVEGFQEVAEQMDSETRGQSWGRVVLAKVLGGATGVIRIDDTTPDTDHAALKSYVDGINAVASQQASMPSRSPRTAAPDEPTTEHMDSLVDKLRGD